MPKNLSEPIRGKEQLKNKKVADAKKVEPECVEFTKEHVTATHHFPKGAKHFCTEAESAKFIEDGVAKKFSKQSKTKTAAT